MFSPMMIALCQAITPSRRDAARSRGLAVDALNSTSGTIAKRNWELDISSFHA